MPAKFELIAPCFFGCESTAKFELTRIGAENIRVDDGRLSFAGGAEMIAAANLNLRTVERVEVLPYHTLGLFKWEKLGIPYTLEGVRPPSEQEKKQAEELLGIG